MAPIGLNTYKYIYNSVFLCVYICIYPSILHMCNSNLGLNTRFCLIHDEQVDNITIIRINDMFLFYTYSPL